MICDTGLLKLLLGCMFSTFYTLMSDKSLCFDFILFRRQPHVAHVHLLCKQTENKAYLILSYLILKPVCIHYIAINVGLHVQGDHNIHSSPFWRFSSTAVIRIARRVLQPSPHPHKFTNESQYDSLSNINNL